MRENISIQKYRLTHRQRESRNQHKAVTIWLTGLSGSGKSSIANELEQQLFAQGIQVYVLDGDNIRLGLNKDLDFSREGRKENIRRVAETAKLFNEAGVLLITAFISPYQADREMAGSIIGKDRFLEVFTDADIACCMQRDVKGLYKKAKEGLIENFTGVSDTYERPETPYLRLHTENEHLLQSVERLVLALKKDKIIPDVLP